jgi:CMP-N-acetylneuraminic acid synthetase
MKLFLFVKEKSERLKNKNFLLLGGIELYKHTLLKLKDFDVYLDTDSKRIYNECKQDKNLSHVTCYMRKQEYIDMELHDKENSPALLMTRLY